MRITTLASQLILSHLATSQLIVPYIDQSALSALAPGLGADHASRLVAGPYPDLGPADEHPLDSEPDMSATSSSLQTISDHLGALKSINIFSGLTRDVHSVNTRLESSGEQTTLLCPPNSAMTALDRKPWQTETESSAGNEANTYSGPLGESKADENLGKFVEGHVVMKSPWEEGEKRNTMAGNEVWWVQDAGGRKIMPAGVEVERVEKRAGNGEIWVLKGVLA